MTISEIVSKQDISKYVAQVDENKMNRLAVECQFCLNQGYVPENSLTELIIDQTGCNFLDVCVPVALEYTRRNAMPF